MAIIYLGLGSNLGDREGNIKEALKRLGSAAVTIQKVSSFYETEPCGGPSQCNYINAAAKAFTPLPPERLLVTVKEIERGMGRTAGPRNGPRTIDIDILLYDELVLKTENLEIPHSRMHERAFVLRGMAEIAPDVVHPAMRMTMGELYEAL